jgi:hypothetical protein
MMHPGSVASPFAKDLAGSITLSPVAFISGFLTGSVITACLTSINPIAGGVFQGTAFAVTLLAQPIIKKIAEESGFAECAPVVSRIVSLIVASAVAFSLSSLIVQLLGFGLTLAEIAALITISVTFLAAVAIPVLLVLAVGYVGIKRFCPNLINDQRM